MLGYYKDPLATSEVLNDGWFRTGDLGRLDAEGNLYIVGRSKSMIVLRGGKKVYPEEVEAVINQCPLLEEVCVLSVAVQSEDGNYEIVGAAIRPTKEVTNVYKDEALNKFMTQQLLAIKPKLADYKWPQRFVYTSDELPKTTTKKFKRLEIVKLFEPTT